MSYFYDIMASILIFIVFGLIFFGLALAALAKDIEQNWPKYKCNPAIMPFAGTFGKFSSISFYQSHHISAVEGGMILTDDNYYADILRSMRANGWLREVTNMKTKKNLIKKFKNIDPSFMFPYIGFNFKPTDLNAALVSKQVDKLNS